MTTLRATIEPLTWRAVKCSRPPPATGRHRTDLVSSVRKDMKLASLDRILPAIRVRGI
jgi:hypothetical protein